MEEKNVTESLRSGCNPSQRTAAPAAYGSGAGPGGDGSISAHDRRLVRGLAALTRCHSSRQLPQF